MDIKKTDIKKPIDRSDYYLYYQIADEKYKVLSNKIGNISNMNYDEWHKLERAYVMPKKFKGTEKGLRKYHTEFNKWVIELSKSFNRDEKGNKTELNFPGIKIYNIDVIYAVSINVCARLFVQATMDKSF